MKYLSRFFLSITVISFFLVIGCSGTKKIADPKQSHLERASTYSKNKSGQALLIWNNGKLILKDYQNGAQPDSRYLLGEISTILSGLTVLAAAEDDSISLDEAVSNSIIEWQESAVKSNITISQLLHLTSGLEGGSLNSFPTIKEAIYSSAISPPGERFCYGPLAYQIFGIVIKRKLGMSYLRERILKPLNIKGGYWIVAQETSQYETDISNMPRYFDGANLTARELGRIGQLLIQEGDWKGNSIIKELSPLTETTEASPGYGLGVWVNKRMNAISSDSSFTNNLPENIFRFRKENSQKLIFDNAPTELYMAADSRFNHRLYIIPSRKMVVVRMGSTDLTWSDAEFLSMLLQN